MPARHHEIGRPVHASEREAIQYLVHALSSAYSVYSNIDIPAGRTWGSSLEHDAIVVGPHGVWCVEIKGYAGKVKGNRDRWQLADGAIVNGPVPGILHKARVLKGWLAGTHMDLQAIRVEPLVFLSAEDAQPDFAGDFGHLIVTRRDISSVLQDAQGFVGAAITTARRQLIERKLGDGLPHRQRSIQGLDLQEQLPAEGRPYELWLAVHGLTQQRRLVHLYVIDGRNRAEQDRRLQRASREAGNYDRLRGIGGVLPYLGDKEDVEGSPRRVALQFEDTTPYLPLGTWLREYRPGPAARLKVAARIARTVAEVHGRKLVHRRLSPAAVLVDPAESPERVYLTDFEMARDTAGSTATASTRAWTEQSQCCAAPELLRSGRATDRSDLFSLGVVLWQLLTDRVLFRSPDEVLLPFELPPLALNGHAYAEGVAAVLRLALAAAPELRPVHARLVAEELARALAGPQVAEAFQFEPGKVLAERYELLRELGTGATSVTWLCRDTRLNKQRVLKIVDSDYRDSALREQAALAAVRHPSLVELHDTADVDGRAVLVLSYAKGETGELQAGAGDPLSLAAFAAVASGLLGAVSALHATGYLHRDVKPSNVLLDLGPAGGSATLIDLGLACSVGCETDLAVGTPHYKDPLVFTERQWSPASDLFALGGTLYEIATGTRAFGDEPPESAKPAQLEASLLPTDWPVAARTAVVACLATWLASDRADRPATVAVAAAALARAVNSVTLQAVAENPPLAGGSPTGVDPHARLVELPWLHRRAVGAAARLGLRYAGDLVDLDVAALGGLAGVGTQPQKQLRDLAALMQSMGATAMLQVQRRPLCVELLPDIRSLDVVELPIPAEARDRLLDAGVAMLGVLAGLSRAALGDLTGLREPQCEQVEQALRRVAGVAELPADLAELRAALLQELGDTGWAELELAFGLDGAPAPNPADLAALLAVADGELAARLGLLRLAAAASVGQTVACLVDQAVPPIGIADAETVAQLVAERLPGLLPAHARGWVQLAQAIAVGALVATGEPVLRRPWTAGLLGTVRATVATAASWPPVARSQVEKALAAQLPDELRLYLAREGLGCDALLDALLRLDHCPAVTDTGLLYTPPVPVDKALHWLRLSLPARGSAAALLALCHGQLVGIVDSDCEATLQAAGWQRDGDDWIDPTRVEVVPVPGAVLVDPGIPQYKRWVDLPPVIAHLADAAATGGMRVIATAPGKHAELSRTIGQWLGDAAGRERVAYVAVEPLLLHAMRGRPLIWDLVPAFEKPGVRADWRFAHEVCVQALEQALLQAVPGRITVLGETALLGTLGLLPWLQRRYERSRGGRDGLVVVVVPGGVHEQRVRLNEVHPFPCTPDMGAVYVEAGL